MGKLFASWWFVSSIFLTTSVFANGEWSGSFHASLHGTLVKKYFSAPKAVKNPPFGWFVDLDKPSQKIITDLFDNLSDHERELYADIDLQSMRLRLLQFAIREWARDHSDTNITVEGEISPPDLDPELLSFNFTPKIVFPEISEEEITLAGQSLDEYSWEPDSFDWSEDNDQSLVLPDEKTEHLVTMTGKLHLEILNYDFELGEIENGGYPIYCWMVKLDPKSFEIACTTPVRACFQTPSSIRSSKKGDELWLTGDFDADWLCENVNQSVAVQGYLWHAHTAHHHTPVMLDTDPWFK